MMLKFTHVIERGFEMNTRTVPQYLHIILPAVATTCVGKRISSLKSMVENRTVTFLGVFVNLQKVTWLYHACLPACVSVCVFLSVCLLLHMEKIGF
jgi:hypothetical protein